MLEKDPLNLILLNIGYAIHEADWNWSTINSPFFRIYLVMEGHSYVTIAGTKHLLTPGHLYLIPPFTLHSDSCDTHFSLYYIHVYENHLQDISLFDEMSFPFEVEAFNVDKYLFQRLKEINPDKELMFYDPKSYESSSILYSSIADSSHKKFPVFVETQGILWQIFSRFLSKASGIVVTKDPRILKGIKYIHENIEKNMTIGELASLCFLSDDHFIRLFKQEIGLTPIHYINQKKIEASQLMMIIQNIPIKDVAFALSFENITYFNRLFRRLVGKTPTQYKKSLANPG